MENNFLKEAEQFCIKNKHRLTEPRLEVLNIIASSAKPIGAYEILKRLSEKIENPKPPTAYRAIDFWKMHGFVHRIESLNAYVFCEASHKHKGSQFMICDDCGNVIEVHLCTLPKPLQKKADENIFKPQNWSLEIHGFCEDCLHQKDTIDI